MPRVASAAAVVDFPAPAAPAMSTAPSAISHAARMKRESPPRAQQEAEHGAVEVRCEILERLARRDRGANARGPHAMSTSIAVPSP